MAARSARATLGTFGGVFTPSILTILGLILFLRLGFVVGNGGMARALAILAIATAISVLTTVSLSAVATNRKVKGGGDYYLISRSLGIGFGGALGLVLFVAQSVSVAFYCVGFGEGVASLVPGASPSLGTIVATCAAAGLLAVAYLGADLATRFQFVIMAVLGAALVSFFTGGFWAFRTETLLANWSAPEGGLGFWPLFAIFFPAVTGFTQGVSMSGDLRDPEKSLPLGTFSAVGISTLVYAAVIILLAGSRPAADLSGDYLVMKRIASVSPLIDAGILAATLSSALSSFLGAPRILQALAADRIFGMRNPFAARHGPSGNPRRAVFLTAIIALGTIAAGNLNAIAAVVSMFFLISYGLLNYATYVEATAASPSFRPRFRFFHARASLAGTLLCAAVMLAIDPAAGLIAVAVLAAIYQYVVRTAVPARWRDSRRAYRFRRVSDGLRELAEEPGTAADWQPQILVFTEGLERRGRVLAFGSWIAGGTGVVTGVRLLEAEATLSAHLARCREAEEELRNEIAGQQLEVFPLAVAAPDLRVAMSTVLQAWGIGPIRANTVLVNWLSSDGKDGKASAQLWYGRVLAGAISLEQNVVVLDSDETAWVRLGELPNHKRRIDVWWFDDESSRLMLLLAHLVTRHDEWDEASLRVLVPASAESETRVSTSLTRRLEEVRIDAAVETVVEMDLQAIVDRSKDAALVFVPLRIQGMKLSDPFGLGLEPLLERLPLVAMVAAAQDIRLGEDREIARPVEGDEAKQESSPPADTAGGKS
jgi:amino acid transporter